MAARSISGATFIRLEAEKGQIKIATSESINEEIRDPQVSQLAIPFQPVNHSNFTSHVQIGSLRKSDSMLEKPGRELFTRRGMGRWLHFADLRVCAPFFLCAFCERCACYIRGRTAGRVFLVVLVTFARLQRPLYPLSSKAQDNGIAISMRKHLFPRIPFTL